MTAPILSLLLGCPFLALLAWHIWRDRRAARRNTAGCCYTCGWPLDVSTKCIAHYEGEAYLYCGPYTT